MREWYAYVCDQEWSTTQGIKRSFASASFVGRNRVVLNVGGNNYRIVVVALLSIRTLYIRFVGTHAQYDRINVS